MIRKGDRNAPSEKLLVSLNLADKLFGVTADFATVKHVDHAQLLNLLVAKGA